MMRLAQKEVKLEKIKKSMMTNCTFRPVTNIQSKSRDQISPNMQTRRSQVVTPRMMGLPRKITPRKPSPNFVAPGILRKSPVSTDTTNSSGSSRLDQLYHAGVQQAKSRRLLLAEEPVVRKRRPSELQKRWYPKKDLERPNRSDSPGTAPASPRRRRVVSMMQPETPKKDRYNPPPLDVVDMNMPLVMPDSPSKWPYESAFAVSPLRDPSLLMANDDSDTSSSYSLLYTPSIAEKTEYGSI